MLPLNLIKENLNECERRCVKMEHYTRITLEMNNQAIYFDEGGNKKKRKQQMLAKVLHLPKLIGLMHETKISLGAYI